jgi:hypothetical protein
MKQLIVKDMYSQAILPTIRRRKALWQASAGLSTTAHSARMSMQALSKVICNRITSSGI